MQVNGEPQNGPWRDLQRYKHQSGFLTVQLAPAFCWPFNSLYNSVQYEFSTSKLSTAMMVVIINTINSICEEC